MVSSHVKISYFYNISLLSLHWTTVKFVGVWLKHLQIFFVRLKQSLAIFGNVRKICGKVRKMSGNVRLAFGTILENLRKSSESDRKSSENCQKRRHQHVYIIKRTLLEDMNFMFSWQELYLTCLLSSLVRYSSCHSNIRFISSPHCVISSMRVFRIPFPKAFTGICGIGRMTGG